MFLVGTVVLLVIAAAMPAVGADGRAKAPVGVWAGPGDSGDPLDTGSDDYVMIAIADGPEGNQSAFYVETVVGGLCEQQPGVVYGTAAKADGVITITGDLVCESTGGVYIEDIEFSFTEDGSDLVPTEGTSGPHEAACGDGLVTIEGTDAGERLEGTDGNDIIDGMGGNDTILGKGGHDILCGGEGKNKLKGGADIDVMVGGPANDKIIGGGGIDFGLGGGGKDTMKGGGGDDVMLGEAKNDTILGGGGSGDVADGGAGTDICDAENLIACELGLEMKVTSSAFKNGKPIPDLHACPSDVSPQLKIANMPAGTETLAIVLRDPDAPGGTWDHWVVYDIEVANKIPEGATDLGTDGRNSWGDLGYGGPCPPSGTHRYFFDVYAVDTTLDLAPGATKTELLDALEGHILGEDSLMGRYSA
jgi:Raf kinase inhibitor-like YbhB/YbcL family protein